MTRRDEIREKALRDLQQYEVLHAQRALRLRQRLSRQHVSEPAPVVSLSSTIWRFAQDLIDVLPGSVLDATEVVAGPATGGRLLAHTIAGLLDSRRPIALSSMMFAPLTVNAERGHTLSRFYQAQVRGRKVLLVDDVRNTGQTLVRCAG
jgi:orotate phosphoribosyltransferase-like protein